MKKFLSFVVVALLSLSVSAEDSKKATVNSVEWTYVVLDETAKTCKVGAGDAKKDITIVAAIDESITGSITVPESIEGYKVVEINHSAFKRCQVSSIIVPNTVATIGNEAFKKCNSLTKLEIGTGLTSMGEDALSESVNLTDVTIFATTPPPVKTERIFSYNASHPENSPQSAKLHVPAGCKAAYAAAGGWKVFCQCGGIFEDAATGISHVKQTMTSSTERYTLDGRRTNSGKGVNIIRMSDGTTKKVVVK